MKDVKPRVVAIIPCYNTAAHITEVSYSVMDYDREKGCLIGTLSINLSFSN